MLLTAIWLLVLPLCNIARLAPAEEHSHLTRLYIRVWLYTIFNAGLESLFFEGATLCGSPSSFPFTACTYSRARFFQWPRSR